MGNCVTPSPTRMPKPRIPNGQQATSTGGGGRWWNEPVQTWHGEHAGGDGGATPHFLFMRFGGLLIVKPDLRERL